MTFKKIKFGRFIRESTQDTAVAFPVKSYMGFSKTPMMTAIFKIVFWP